MSGMTSQLRIAGVLALAAVVVGAAATPLHTELSVSKGLAIVAIVAPAALIPALMVRYALARRWLPLMALFFAGCIGATVAVSFLVNRIHIAPIKRKGSSQGGSVPAGGGNQHTRTTEGAAHAGHLSLSTGLVVALVLILVAVVVAAIVLAVRRQPPPAVVAAPRKLVEEPAPEEVVRRFYSLIGDTLEDLRAEPDARTAVIAAYARMEAGLGQLGIERLRSETPFEYLARVLERLSVSDAAARELTDLFERAKFSNGPVDADMKEHAIAALEAIREEARAWRR
jgi:hypothetical protein